MIKTSCAYSANPSCTGDCYGGEGCDGYREHLEADVVVGLCEGRHPLPVNSYVFTGELDPVNFTRMNLVAGKRLRSIMAENPEMNVIGIYVTGLTAALAAVIRNCQHLGLGVVLYHFNRDTNAYDEQLALWPRE